MAPCVLLERDGQVAPCQCGESPLPQHPCSTHCRKTCPAVRVFVGHQCSTSNNGRFSPAKPRPLHPLPQEQRRLCISFSIYFYKEGERESHPNLAKCQGVIQRRGEQQREAAHTGELFLISKCQHVL